MRNEIIHLKDIYPFLGVDNADPTLETFLPHNDSLHMNRGNQKRPCIIICPGGGYNVCSKRESEPIALKYLQAGFNVFLLTYSPGTWNIRFPAQLNEVAAVMQLVYENAEKWNCDIEKIAIIGFSAGGHLAAHYSTAFDCEEVRKNFPESKSVNATILCYPVISADHQFDDYGGNKGSFLNLLGHPLNDDDINKLSCEKLVTDNTPSAFIWHTAEDTCVSVKISILYASALSEHKIPFELHIFPYGDHGLSTCDYETIDNPGAICEYDKVWIQESIKWLKLMLKFK